MARNTHINSVLSNLATDHETRESQVLAAYRRIGEPATDRQIAEMLRYADMNAVRPFITGLVYDGILKQTESVRCKVTGRIVRACEIQRRGGGLAVSKMQRDKGKRGERMHAKVLRELGFSDARRGVQYAGGPDSPDVVGIPGAHAEVKFYANHAATKYMRQSVDEARDGEVPYVVLRANGMGLMDEIICVRAKDLVSFATKITSRK